MSSLGVALIGCGGVALANHVPGLKLARDAALVALCDSSEQVLAQAAEATGIRTTLQDYRQIMELPEVDAVIIATPNRFHAPMAKAAASAGKHVLCEKPLAMGYSESQAMLDAVDKAGICHMTAFTYRFVPAMRFMAHLVDNGEIGTPFHFRSSRLQDWSDRYLGWRQSADLAGTGELGDMLSHRIDFAHLLFGPIQEVVADQRQFFPTREGNPSDLEDWVGLMARFANGATGMLESSKAASGHGEGGYSQDFCEVTGSRASLIYNLERPNEIQIGKQGERLSSVSVPRDFLTLPDSPRNPDEGDPVATFRYDQDIEFVQAIHDRRPCQPSFHDGARVQAVMDAALQSIHERTWTSVP